MDIKTFLLIFGTVFLAELGDKTQLATLLFASKPATSLVLVFAAAALALLLSTGLAVVAGAMVAKLVDPRVLTLGAGIGFVLIGCWTIFQAVNS